jgi:hypothetical protein
MQGVTEFSTLAFFYPHELGKFFGIDLKHDNSPKRFAKGKLIFKKVRL